MRVAILLYAHSPWGGRERNAEGVARALAEAGHEVHVFTRSWEARRPPGLVVHALGTRGLTNIGRDTLFVRAAERRLAAEAFDARVAFDLFPEADLFYAADPCLARALAERSALARLTRRARRRLGWERALCAPGGRTWVLCLTEEQRTGFHAAWETPEERLFLLPGNLDDEPLRTRAEGAGVLAELGVREGHLVLLFVGSDFRRKGLDRAVEALPGLPPGARLVVIGDDDPRLYRRRAERLRVAHRLLFAGPREDVATFQARADVFCHPARKETAGVVVLEAMRQGTCVVTTAACGFAPQVARAGAGVVLAEPFRQRALTETLARLCADPAERERLGARGAAWTRRGELYGRHARVRALVEAFAAGEHAAAALHAP